jgi:predicted transposase YdaD
VLRCYISPGKVKEVSTPTALVVEGKKEGRKEGEKEGRKERRKEGKRDGGQGRKKKVVSFLLCFIFF